MYLAASAINNLVRALPVGTAYFIGLVLLTMFTGQLVYQQGSLARAALPYVGHLRWGRHRGDRARERGKVSRAVLFDRAFTWGLACLPVEPVRLGQERRTVHALDSSTVARLRANKKRCALLGKGVLPARPTGGTSQHRRRAHDRSADRRGTGRGGAPHPLRGTCQEAVANVFAALPESLEKRLFSVDAGSATIEQWRTATERAALVGRLRKNVTLRRASHPKRLGQRGRPARHGPVVHPGVQRPERRPDEDTTVCIEDREVRVRRWRNLHFQRPLRPVLLECAWMTRPTSVPG